MRPLFTFALMEILPLLYLYRREKLLVAIVLSLSVQQLTVDAQ